MISAELLRLHFDYTFWATDRLLRAAAPLTPEEINCDFKTADKSVLGTLVHVFAADRVWLSRIEQKPRTTFVSPEDYDFSVLQKEWPALLGRWKSWAAGVSDAALAEPCVYKDLKGNPRQNPLWQIALHVVNHATHHRGQVSGFLRAMGKTPPPLDLIAFYREKFPE